MKQHLSKGELLSELSNQLNKIELLSKSYDDGELHFAQDIAVKIRILFHNSNASKSLLKQLKLDHIYFVDTSNKYKPENLFSHTVLIKMKLNSPEKDFRFIPMGIDAKFKLVSFDNWWEGKKVIVDKPKNSFTRKRLILEVANADGGAHVDSELKEDYYNLTRNNTTGWMIKFSSGEQTPFNDPTPPSIRQIADEVLKTFSLINLETASKLRS